MKKIDSAFRHLSEHDALEAMEIQQCQANAVESRKAFLKQEEVTRENREKLVKEDRRRFLGLVAKSGISTALIRAFPIIGGLLSSRYAMADDPLNKRVVFCYIPSGGWKDKDIWLPSSVNNMNSQTRPYGDRGVADLCAFRKVHVVDAGHSGSKQCFGLYGGARGGDTMDKRLSKILGATTVREALYLGAQANGDGWDPLGSSLGPCNDDPHNALKSIFGGVPPTPTDTTFRIAFDSQIQALESIRTKIGSDEFHRFQEHFDKIEKIKKEYEEIANKPVCNSNIPIDTSTTQKIGRAQADIIVSALACGITKVATLQIGHHQGGRWQAQGVENGHDPHGCAHGFGNDSSKFEGLTRYCYDVSAYLLSKLRSTTGPDGQPLIRSTVFAQITCMGEGKEHSPENAGFLLATEMPGFKHGFSIDGRAGTQMGSAANFIGAIPKGMGLGTQIPFGSNDTLGLLG